MPLVVEEQAHVAGLAAQEQLQQMLLVEHVLDARSRRRCLHLRGLEQRVGQASPRLHLGPREIHQRIEDQRPRYVAVEQAHGKGMQRRLAHLYEQLGAALPPLHPRRQVGVEHGGDAAVGEELAGAVADGRGARNRHLDQIEIAEFTRVDQHVGAIADVIQRDHLAGCMVVRDAKRFSITDDVQSVIAELLGDPLPGAVEIVRLKQDMIGKRYPSTGRLFHQHPARLAPIFRLPTKMNGNVSALPHFCVFWIVAAHSG